jgi:hypothetical protein
MMKRGVAQPSATAFGSEKGPESVQVTVWSRFVVMERPNKRLHIWHFHKHRSANKPGSSKTAEAQPRKTKNSCARFLVQPARTYADANSGGYQQQQHPNDKQGWCEGSYTFQGGWTQTLPYDNFDIWSQTIGSAEHMKIFQTNQQMSG